MSNIAHASGLAAMIVTMVAAASAEARQRPPESQQTLDTVHAAPPGAGDPTTLRPTRQRIRSISERTGELLDLGYERSPTFKSLVDTLEQSAVQVYVEPGRCPAIRRQRLNGCLARLGMAGGARHLRVTVDASLPTDQLIATIGHELQHAVETSTADALARERREAPFGPGTRHVGANVYETDAAQDVEEAILHELRRARPGAIRRTPVPQP